MKRRDVLKRGAAVLGGAASMVSGASAQQGSAGPGARAPREFRAFIRTNAGASVQTVRMLPLRDNMGG